MEDTESPNKRFKPSAPNEQASGADFISFDSVNDNDGSAADQFGYSANSPPDNSFTNDTISGNVRPSTERQERSAPAWRRDFRNDPRHAKDRPKSKHVLPGYEPWVLVRTKYGRKFVHNTKTGLSLWRIPGDLFEGVKEFERLEGLEGEKAGNARWAEEQLKDMRTGQSAKADGPGDTRSKDGAGEGRRRRRSESLQREDEQALMAELAAEAEKGEEENAKAAVKNVEGLQPRVVDEGGYGSDSSYEEVEVTDSEFEDENGTGEHPGGHEITGVHNGADDNQEDGLVEFGEDDIAYQLAAMEAAEDENDLEAAQQAALDEMADGETYEDYAQDDVEMVEGEETGVSEAEAIADFHNMLNDHSISPFIPWETLLTNESLLYDERFTLLPSTRDRKAAWESWVKEAAARRAEERAAQAEQDPKVPYLAFLAEKANGRLYWQEFKRKFRSEAVMGERKMGDKEREKLYRDFVARLKLPENKRKAELVRILESTPLAKLNWHTTLNSLPQDLLGNVNFMSVPASTRDSIVQRHIASLPTAPDTVGEDGELDPEAEAKKRKEDEKRAKALSDREKQVEDARRKAEKEERWAKREAREAEREVQDAMRIGREGLKGQLG